MLNNRIFCYCYLLFFSSYFVNIAEATNNKENLAKLIAICPLQQTMLKGVKYVDISQIIPAQIRYSYDNAQAKIEQAIKDKAAVKIADHYLYCYDNNKSIYATSDAVPVIKAPLSFSKNVTRDMYVLIDGHHIIKASLALGATTIPIKIKEDWSQKDVKTFWSDAEKKGYAYLYTIDGHKVEPPKSFDQLIDDPIRGFMAKVAIKCEFGKSLPNFNAAHVVWLKVVKKGEKDILFIEFKAADALKKAGFRYKNGQTIDGAIALQAREILANPKFKVDGLRVLSLDNSLLKIDGTGDTIYKVCGVK